MTRDEELARLLKRHFGYDDFRPLQQEIMGAALAGRDVLAILPTGAGKSLCYQLPALAREGVTLVVSPLIALMKDQVDQLEAGGVAATFLNSSLDPAENRRRLQGLRAGAYKLVYLAPERLMTGDFLPRLDEWRVTALAVDEAHCISEWGHDFRPEYRRLRELRERLPEAPVMALTATATPRVREDIVSQLGLRDPADFLASFNRPNLSYAVEPKNNATAQTLAFIRRRGQESGIVYCQSRKRSEELAASLRGAGISAVCYHAGLEAEERARNQDAFLRDEVRVVCATVAFGMGINKPDVRFVIHADLPKNVESYYQETGRAGRDGLPADCLLLYSRGDVARLQYFLDGNPDPEARDTARQQIDRMADFAESDGCRRTDLLAYFGETREEENCGACDNCLSPRETWNATIEAQKLLCCAERVWQAGGFRVGLKHLADVLTGSRGEKIMRWKHDKLSTYGIGKEHSAAKWMEIGRQLLRNGWFATEGGNFPTMRVTPEGMALLKERRPVSLTRLLVVDKPAVRRAGEIECDTGLFDVLRAFRKRLADAAGVPPYVVFADVALRHMAREYPADEAAFLRIPGVGARKLADYGAGFMGEIAAWLAEHPRMSFPPLESPVSAARPSSPPTPNGTAMVSLELWRTGKSVEEVAASRRLATSTIENHLAQAVETGMEIDVRRIYSESEEAEMRAALDGYAEEALKPVFEHLGGRISYGKLRLFRAVESRRQKALT